jgi:predicted secreted protein
LRKRNVNNRKVKATLNALLVSVLILSAVVCPCACADSMWSQTYGGTEDDGTAGFYIEIVQTSEGGYAIFGITRSFGAGNSDFWLIKTDAAGDMQWNRTYGGALAERSSEMRQTADGGYVMAGSTKSFGAGNEDFWIVKTDSVGNMQWNKTYGGTGTDRGWSIVETTDGGYAVGGWTTSFGAGGTDAWLIKTDATGNMQWNKTFGGSGTDYGLSLAQTGDGGYTFLGSTTSFGAGSTDLWLIKTDSGGNMQWNKTYGTTEFEEGYGMKPTSDGGYIIGATTGPFVALNAWLVKTDGSGNMQWNKTYGGTMMELGGVAIQTNDGGYAMTIQTTSFGAGGTDAWLVKTDADGNMQWNRTYGGTGSEDAYCLIQTSDGGYAIGGWTDSFGAGGIDIWLVKTDEYGVIPEDLTVGVMLLLSTVAAIVGIRILQKRPKWKRW